MYKRTPYAKELRIDTETRRLVGLEGNVVNGNRGLVPLNDIDKTMCSKEWLEAASLLELNDLHIPISAINNIKFIKMNNRTLKLRTRIHMLFTEPIYYLPRFRIVPNFTRYACSSDGLILDTHTNALVNIVIDDDGYPSCYIRNADKSANRNIRQHRIIALAWIKCNDYATKYIVNHIDGIKTNNTIDNLEWCTHRENALHAVATGLTNDLMPMKTRDRVTCEVSYHSSVSDMCSSLDIPNKPSKLAVTKLPGYLYKNRYEIKRACDDTKWFYENPDVDSSFFGKTYFIIEIYNNKNKTTRIYNKIKPILKEYGLTYKDGRVETILEWLKKEVPWLDIKSSRCATHGPYVTIHMGTKEITTHNSIVKVGKFIKINHNTIRDNLALGNLFIYNGYAVKELHNVAKLSEFVLFKPKWVPVEITDMDTGLVRKYKSVSAAGKDLGLDPRSIVYRAEKGITWLNFKYRLV